MKKESKTSDSKQKIFESDCGAASHGKIDNYENKTEIKNGTENQIGN